MSKGKIKNTYVGQKFTSCLALSQARIHQYQGPDKKSTTAPGIVTDQDGVASSILLNGGYIDDIDLGNRIIYTGSGGQENKIQITDQVLDGVAGRNNRGLVNAYDKQTPIRVIRGYKHHSNLAPTKGYRYDGIFYIESYKWKHSIYGPKVIMFTLVSEEIFNGERK